MGRSSDDSLACKMKDGTYGSNNCQKCADGMHKNHQNGDFFQTKYVYVART